MKLRPTTPDVVHISHLRMSSLNRVRSALRAASAASRRLRDPASNTHNGNSATSDCARLQEWCIELLVDQVHGDDPAVARASVSVLEEVTQDERCLRILVS